MEIHILPKLICSKQPSISWIKIFHSQCNIYIYKSILYTNYIISFPIIRLLYIRMKSRFVDLNIYLGVIESFWTIEKILI